jgi:hypothetical protein
MIELARGMRRRTLLRIYAGFIFIEADAKFLVVSMIKE